VTDETRTYEIEQARDRIIRITIPATYKVTYGPVIGAAGKPSYGSGGMAFRVWETDKLQRGLWNDVVSFRDVSISVQVRAIRPFGKEAWHLDDGTWEPDAGERDWKEEHEIIPRPTDSDEVF